MISSREIISKKFYYNNLFRDYIFNFKNLSGSYEYDYRDMDHYRKRILDIKKGYSGKSRIKIDNIIKVFNAVSKQVKSKLILVGDGPDICKIRNMVSELNLEGKVIFMGIQENIIPLLNISDLYMLPSKSEGFGLSALEALSCEVPVIGTNIGGLKEVVEHGKSGFVFNPGDINSMIEAAIKILSCKDTRMEMGHEARRRAKFFDSRLIMPKYLKYYEKVLNTA